MKWATCKTARTSMIFFWLLCWFVVRRYLIKDSNENIVLPSSWNDFKQSTNELDAKNKENDLSATFIMDKFIGEISPGKFHVMRMAVLHAVWYQLVPSATQEVCKLWVSFVYFWLHVIYGKGVCLLKHFLNFHSLFRSDTCTEGFWPVVCNNYFYFLLFWL